MNPTTTVLAVGSLSAITLAIVWALRLEHPWLQPWAILRATVQLGVLSLILNNVISSPLWVAAFLLVMVAAATWTVSRRLRLAWVLLPWIALLVAVSAAVPVAGIFAIHAIEFTPRYVLAVGGIVIGNAMTVATVMGRILGGRLVSDRNEIEAWLAIGATPRQAARDAVRAAASMALIPSTDQARTTGIVTLPGAFVGAIFAGSSPLEAAQFQLLVLAAILTAAAVSVAGMAWQFGAPTTLALQEQPLR